uniref:Uncharacterized protein n=1 Tax=Myoviridae sp. ctu2j3 TaxID=2825197 RepID=A0A8S5UI28_9CAUD|nr:MAG TPA: hypothetical protein [Myoviridae sp. ctu2j3]
MRRKTPLGKSTFRAHTVENTIPLGYNGENG